jgi:apolipoprotein N-acyltransferase
MAHLPDWRRLLLLLLAGGSVPLAFAPFGLYPLAVLAPLPLFAFWLKAPPRQAMVAGFVFGLGQFGAGVSWVYVAIHDFGHSAAPVAALLTLLLVALLAVIPALVGYLAARFAPRGASTAVLVLLWLPALWALGEWVRGWYLTGFPWLSLGYSQIDSPLAGYAPLLGVFGVSWLVALSAGALLWLWQARLPALRWVLPLLLAIWGGGALLGAQSWSEPLGEPLRVTLIQGNLPQSTKWDPAAIRTRLERYAELTQLHFDDSDLVIWPENAVTVFYHDIKEAFFDGLAEDARASGTDLILGVPLLDDDGERYYTTLMSLGSSHAFYRKRHLVPFGEFLPLEGVLRGLINFFDLPMSSFSPGPKGQPLLQAAGHKVAATVCYEDAFGEEMIDFLPEASLLVNGSNNAWYGDSLAPHQHLQISRMRALETGRPMLRATTNGISALIDEKGEIRMRSAQFRTEMLSGSVQPMQGATPYVRWGNWTVVMLLLGIVAVVRWGGWKEVVS